MLYHLGRNAFIAKREITSFTKNKIRYFVYMRIFIVWLLLFPSCLQAQLLRPGKTIFIYHEQDAQQFLIEHLDMFQSNSDLSIRLEAFHKTKFSEHYRFELLYKAIPVWNKHITLHTQYNGKLLSYHVECDHIDRLRQYGADADFEAWSQVHPEQLLAQHPQYFSQLKSSYLKIEVDHEIPQLILEANAWSKTSDRSLLLRYDGEVVQEINHQRNFSDTVIQAKIWYPDPLTTLQKNYGGWYKDSDDCYQTWQDSAVQVVQIPARFSNGVFYPENDVLTLEEFESPIANPVTQTTPDFFYQRNQSGFEDMMVLYHLTNMHNYVSSLGYDSLLSSGILVDAHAQGGADNSVFNRNGGAPTLCYGVGGVDDAEDADVLIHEYAHGLSWSANGNDNFSYERSGLDEGLADYFATSYSRAQNTYQWEQVFSWDGHNEFWDGRIANTSANYPNSASIYTLGEIWNAAMSAIATDLGLVVTDKLMLEAMHFFTDATTLPEAAMYVLQADTLLFGAQFSNTICTRFQQKHILDAWCKPVQLTAPMLPEQPLVVNSQGFAEGSGVLQVIMPSHQRTRFMLYDQTACILLQEDNKKGEIQLSPQCLSSGVYYLHCITEDRQYTIKLNRF